MPAAADQTPGGDLGSYSNLPARPSGPLLRALERLLPGVRAVAAQTAPYAASWAAANQTALTGEGLLWVALGDSMTQGIGASAFDRGWVGQTRDLLAERRDPMRVVNLSVFGARTQDVIDHQIPALESLTHRPELVTVLVGSNDVASPSRRRALPAAFLDLLSQLPAGAIVAELPPIAGVGPAAGREITSLAQQRDISLVPIVETNWRGSLASDHYHPNDRGYQLIATAFATPMLQRLERINDLTGQGATPSS